MAEPTFDEGWVKLKAAMKLFNAAWSFGGTDSPNVVSLLRSYEEAVKASGAEAAAASSALQVFRANASSNVGRAAARTVMDPLISVIARSTQVKSSARAPEAQLRDIYEYMRINSKSVNAREFTRGSFVSGSPYVGDGEFRRVTTDAYGFPLEADCPDTYTCKVVRDQTGGVKPGKEVWRVSPLPYVDELEWGTSGRGSGDEREFSSINGDDSLLQNASFGDRSGTDALPTAIPGWTSSTAVIGDGTDYAFNSAEYYQASPEKEGTAPKSLEIKLTRTLTQALSVANIVPSFDRPYWLEVAWTRSQGTFSGAGTGTLALHLGGKSVSVTAAAQTGWQVLKLPTSSDADLWPSSWFEDAPDVKIVWTRTTGSILIDRVLLRGFNPYRGHFVLPISRRTPWTYGDRGTFTDSISSDATIARSIGRYYGISLPSATGGGETISDY